jgi:GNAT superfamily N-acetyltransferase
MEQTMNQDDYQIFYEPNPVEEAWGIIGEGINSYNTQHAGADNPRRICYTVRGPDGTTAGGVIGVVFWDWLYVDLMWLPEALRGRGFGRQLLQSLEDEARKQGARYAFLDTFSFQAPGFYQKYGYQVYGQLPDFPAGHTRFYLKKEL